MDEVKQAVMDEAKTEEEMGDLVVQVTVQPISPFRVKPKPRYKKPNDKFERRFREVERIVAPRGLEMSGIDPMSMEEVWQR